MVSFDKISRSHITIPLVLRPSHYISIHQSAIRSVAWVKAPPRTLSDSTHLGADPTVVLSGGYDGALMVTDLRDLRGNIICRTRGSYLLIREYPY